MGYLRQDTDPKSLLKEGIEIRSLKRTPLTLSLLLDESSPRELLEWLEAYLKVQDPHLSFDIRSFSKEHLGLKDPSDLAIVVAGDSPMVGPTAAIIEAGGTPVVVLAIDQQSVMQRAKEVGFPLDEDKVLAFTGSDRQFGEQLGSWVCSHCEEAMAFSRVYPFIRRSTTSRLVRSTALQNALVGFIPLIPGADFPTMTYNQLSMLLREETAFGEPLDLRSALALLLCLGGALGSRSLARFLCKAYPAFSLIIKGACGGLATLAVGEGAYLFLERGWGKERLDGLQSRALDRFRLAAQASIGGE